MARNRRGSRLVGTSQPFVSVKTLYIVDRLGLTLSSVLEDITGESVTEVLPALHNLFIRDLGPNEKFVEKTMTPFVSARQLYGHPIVEQRWEREENEDSDRMARLDELLKILQS